MANYKLLYATMFRAAEEAIEILVEAQRKCEEIYMEHPEIEADLKILKLPKKDGRD